MRVQSSHCKQLRFLLLAASRMARKPSSHPKSNSNIQLSSLWSARKLSVHSLIPIHHWVKAALRGINSIALQTEREPPTGAGIRLLLLACAGLVSAQASGTGTDIFCYTLDSSLLTSLHFGSQQFTWLCHLHSPRHSSLCSIHKK